MSDQQASTFTNPLFAPLKFKAARYITPYDVMDSPSDLAAAQAWIGAADAANQRVLVSFEHSHRAGRERHLPSVAEYKREITKFHQAFPQVKEISVWNEVNRCQSSVAARGPADVRQGAAPRVVLQGRAPGLQVARHERSSPSTCSTSRTSRKTISTIKKFKRFAGSKATILGFHNYSDTNRFSTTRTRRVLAAWRGKVWLTETGGLVKLGRSFPRSTTRAAKALGCMFTLAKSNSRIQRLYVYQFNPAFSASDDFDAGLINPDGSKRPGYAVVQAKKARSCHK